MSPERTQPAIKSLCCFPFLKTTPLRRSAVHFQDYSPARSSPDVAMSQRSTPVPLSRKVLSGKNYQAICINILREDVKTPRLISCQVPVDQAVERAE